MEGWDEDGLRCTEPSGAQRIPEEPGAMSCFTIIHPKGRWISRDLGNSRCTPNKGRSNRQIWGRQWQPTPVFLPEEFHGQRSLLGHSPWSHKELDTTEPLTHTTLLRVDFRNKDKSREASKESLE